MCIFVKSHLNAYVYVHLWAVGGGIPLNVSQNIDATPQKWHYLERLMLSFLPTGSSCVRRRGRLSEYGSPQQERCSGVRTTNPTSVAGEHSKSVCVCVCSCVCCSEILEVLGG